MMEIMKQYKDVEYIIVTMDEEKPILYGKIKKGENHKEKLEQVIKELKNKKPKQYNGSLNTYFIYVDNKGITEKLTIIKTREYIKKLISYTKNSTVYAIDKSEWEDIEEAYEYTQEQCWVGNRFTIMITDPERYPEKDCELCVHDTLKDKYYISDKMRFNPKKWNFDFNDDNLKATEMPIY